MRKRKRRQHATMTAQLWVQVAWGTDDSHQNYQLTMAALGSLLVHPTWVRRLPGPLYRGIRSLKDHRSQLASCLPPHNDLKLAIRNNYAICYHAICYHAACFTIRPHFALAPVGLAWSSDLSAPAPARERRDIYDQRPKSAFAEYIIQGLSDAILDTPTYEEVWW